MSAHTWSGSWHRPDAPNTPLDGTFTYTPQGEIEGHIIGDLYGHTPVLHGIANGRPVTILNTHMGLRTQGATGQRWAVSDGPADFVLDGRHITCADTPQVTCAHHTITALHAIAGKSLVARSTGEKTEMLTAETAPRTPSQLITHKTDTYSIYTNHLGPQRTETQSGTVWTITESTHLNVHHDPPCTIHASLESTRPILDLIKLATGDNARLLDTHVEFNGDAQMHRLFNRAPVSPALSPTMGLNHRSSWLWKPNHAEFLEVFERFLVLYDRAGDPIRLLTNTRQGEHSLETSLLALATSAESLHAALWDRPRWDSSAFKTQRRIAIDAVNTAFRQAFAEQLDNTLTLKMRLLSIADNLPPEVRAILLPDPKEWAKALKNIRNDMAHTGTANIGAYPDRKPERMRALARITDLVLTSTILYASGISASALTTRIAMHALTHPVEEDAARVAHAA